MTIEAIKIVSTTVTIICTIFTLLLVVIYNSKQKANNPETKIYSGLIWLNVGSLIAELVFYYFFQNNYPYHIVDIFEKTYYAFINSWMYIFTIYILCITKPFENSKIYKMTTRNKTLGIVISLGVIITALIIAPIERVTKDGVLLASSGAAPAIMFMLCIILLIVNFLTVILNRKKVDKKKTLPLYLFLIVMVIEMIVTSTGIQLMLITLPMTLVSFLMYHTIENPDVKMLEEVSIAKEQAEKANTAKSEFLSNMSHEIRTPLNAIVGFSESLKEEQLTEEAKEKIEDIITASQNLLEIVNSILDISKIEANKLEIINKEYEPNEMFKELVSLTKARIGEKGLDFQVNIDQTIPSVLYGDNARVKQIILNILTNAVKYTKEGYVSFTVSSIIKDNVCRLIISVEDSGIGIKQESISKLFSKFERLNVEKQLTIEGTGLGLAITKKLLDIMNGTIIVQSVFGKGSKFTISLDQRIVSMDIPLKKEPAMVESTIIDANGAKLLIVDDNEMNIKVAMTLLKKYHFDISYTNSGLGCIAKTKEKEYDMIFLDDMMPRMSGKQTLAKLKENPDFKTPVIALTANAISGMKEDYLATGFDDYLSKPIEKKELERIIKEFILKDNKKNMNTDTSTTTKSIITEEPKNNILVIDDNIYTSKILENTLSDFKVEAFNTPSIKEAISNVLQNDYKVIFIDKEIKEKSYKEIIDELKSIDGFKTPVVLMLKEVVDEKEIAEIKKMGYTGSITKPIDNTEVEKMYKSIVK